MNKKLVERFAGSNRLWSSSGSFYIPVLENAVSVLEDTYVEVVKLMLTTAPDGVIQVVIFSNQPQRFVGVVPEKSRIVFTLGKSEAPIFNIHMLSPRMRTFPLERNFVMAVDINRGAVKVFPESALGEFEKGRG